MLAVAALARSTALRPRPRQGQFGELIMERHKLRADYPGLNETIEI
jgi:hypothetical protein